MHGQIDNFELAQLRGEEEFHLEEEEFYGNATMKMVKKSHEFDGLVIRELARKQVEENLASRKGKIPEWYEIEDDEEDDEIPF